MFKRELLGTVLTSVFMFWNAKLKILRILISCENTNLPLALVLFVVLSRDTNVGSGSRVIHTPYHSNMFSIFT